MRKWSYSQSGFAQQRLVNGDAQARCSSVDGGTLDLLYQFQSRRLCALRIHGAFFYQASPPDKRYRIAVAAFERAVMQRLRTRQEGVLQPRIKLDQRACGGRGSRYFLQPTLQPTQQRGVGRLLRTWKQRSHAKQISDGSAGLADTTCFHVQFGRRPLRVLGQTFARKHIPKSFKKTGSNGHPAQEVKGV